MSTPPSQPPESEKTGDCLPAAESSTLAELVQHLAPSPEEEARLLGRLADIARVILSANERMNLTGDAEPGLFRERHLEDALWAARRIEEALGKPAEGTRILDVGSGGGIPGLVWAAVWPQARVTLLESRRKRVEFLRDAIEELGFGQARAVENRAETLAHLPEHREQYELVTARALAALPTLLELTLPFAKVGGAVAAIKSAQIGEEAQMAQAALTELGAGKGSMALQAYTRSDGKPCVVCLIRKEAATPALYPRRPNLPERQPLGTSHLPAHPRKTRS